MRHTTIALLAAACFATAAHAAEDYTKPHTLDGVSITGSRTVATSKLTAVLHEHPGDKVTQTDMLADRDAIMKVLEQANVGGAVGVKIAPKVNHHVNVEFTVQDQGAQAPTVTTIANHLHTQTFTGNTSIPTAKLEAATALHAGDVITNEKINAAEAAVLEVYKAAKLPVTTKIGADIQQDKTTGKVDITWQIVETKAKEKKKSRAEQEREDQVQ